MAKKAKARASPKKRKSNVALTRADGTWSEAKYNSFIRSQLRKGWMKWPPKNNLLREARVERGVYKCECCGELTPATVKVPAVTTGRLKKIKGVNVDHIVPATPLTGVYDWDIFAHNLYCERDNLWVICHKCHDYKTQKVERPLGALLSGSKGFPQEAGRYVLEKLLTPLVEPENTLFEAILDGEKVVVSLWTLLSTNGGTKKGEQA